MAFLLSKVPCVKLNLIARFGPLVLLVGFALTLSGQGGRKPAVPEEMNVRVLGEASSVSVPSLGTQLLAMPQVCTSDGSIFAQTASVSSIGDLASISSDGKTVVTFDARKVSDLKNPEVLAFFVADPGVYLLLSTYEAGEPQEVTRINPEGSVENVKMRTVKSRGYAVAKFKSDGSYAGSVSLDVPFIPQQLGVFPTGDMVISGVKADAVEPRVESQLALLTASGRFLKQIELSGDPTARRAQPTSAVGDIFMSASLSQIVADGPNLLVVRPTKNTPLFAISPGGEATATNLEIPEGFSLRDLKVSGAEWIGLIARDVSEQASQILAFDRSTGKIVARYVYPASAGFALACVQRDAFTFVTTQEDNKLMLTKVSRREQ